MPEIHGPDVLAAIVGATRRVAEIRRERTPLHSLEHAASARGRQPGRLQAALRVPRDPRVIAECKRRSPSRGVLRRDYDPVTIARGYEEAGAVAVSVLTEPTFFDGSPDHLIAVRAAVRLPILRKDFIVDWYQLLEACAWGADAVLLIAAVLTAAELAALIRESAELGLDALVEVHSRTELSRALDAGARIIGVNNRDLRTLEVNTATAEALARAIPGDVLRVAESGLRTRADLDRLSAAGYDACLIGERFMSAGSPGQALAEVLR